MKKKASITLFITFLIFAAIIIIIGAIAAPLGTRFATEMYVAGDKIILSANKSLSGIQNETIRNQISANLAAAQGQQLNNIEVATDLYQYSWLFVLILTALIIFIYTRSMVEVNSGGFV